MRPKYQYANLPDNGPLPDDINAPMDHNAETFAGEFGRRLLEECRKKRLFCTVEIEARADRAKVVRFELKSGVCAQMKGIESRENETHIARITRTIRNSMVSMKKEKEKGEA